MAHFKTGCNNYYAHAEQEVQSKHDEIVIFLSAGYPNGIKRDKTAQNEKCFRKARTLRKTAKGVGAGWKFRKSYLTTSFCRRIVRFQCSFPYERDVLIRTLYRLPSGAAFGRTAGICTVSAIASGGVDALGCAAQSGTATAAGRWSAASARD